MFDVGWTELVVIACVAILVVGPKDLPKMLRAFGKTMGNVRKMAGDFRKQFDEAMRETEIDEVRKAATGNTIFNPLEDARKAMLDAQKSVTQALEPSVREIEAAANPAIPAIAAEPVKPVPANPIPVEIGPVDVSPPEIIPVAGAEPVPAAIAVAGKTVKKRAGKKG